MNMDKNSLLAIVFCVVFFIAYQSYMSHKYPNLGKSTPKAGEVAPPDNQTLNSDTSQTPASTSTNQTTTTASTSSDHPEESATTAIPRLADEDLKFDTPDATYTFDQDFSALTSIKMKHYKQSTAADSPSMELLASPLKIQATTNIQDLKGSNRHYAERQGNKITFSRSEGPWQISQSFAIPDKGYEFPITLSFTNKSQHGLDLTAAILLQENVLMDKAGGFGPASFVAQRKSIIQSVAGDRDFEDITGQCQDEDITSIESFKLTNEPIDFIGIDLHYFLTVFKPEATKMSALARKTTVQGEYCPLAMSMYQHMGFIKPGDSVSMTFKAYMGPKDISILEKHDAAFAHTLNFKTMGLDLSIIANPLLRSIQFFHRFVHNYGIAIALVTLILKLLFYPLTKSAAISMKRMQKLQPEITKIREKHKADPQKQQQVLMAFLAKNKANPMKGCLPILPQMPVFLAFYSVLSQAIELRHASLFGWVTDLSVADPYFIMPILLGGLMFAQQKLTPNPSMDPTQQKVMMMMPLIFTFMMLALPAGLVLYMIVNTVVSIGQQQWLNKKFEHMDFKVVPA